MGGRLGVAFLDTATGVRAGQHADERFPICSTFKLVAAGAVLLRVDQTREHLDRMVRVTEKEIVPNSPVTETRFGDPDMSIREIGAATVTRSDNTAGNLLLSFIGGPAGLTAFARSPKNEMTRLDSAKVLHLDNAVGALDVDLDSSEVAAVEASYVPHAFSFIQTPLRSY
jgi:beta-lactamase class A